MPIDWKEITLEQIDKAWGICDAEKFIIKEGEVEVVFNSGDFRIFNSMEDFGEFVYYVLKTQEDEKNH